MMLVGLTGGIGSGKTTVAKLFMEFGVPVYFADQHAKRLMHSSQVLKKKLIQEFGRKTYVDGTLNRAYLAAIVFNDKTKLEAINKIVHPSVGNSFKRWTGKQTFNYVIQENALLFETNSYRKFDFTILITAPLDERIDRVVKRDAIAKKDVLDRIKNQLSDKEKISKADFVVNNLNLEQTKMAVLKIHKRLMNSSLSTR